jgi:hypothetical protein
MAGSCRVERKDGAGRVTFQLGRDSLRSRRIPCQALVGVVVGGAESCRPVRPGSDIVCSA